MKVKLLIAGLVIWALQSQAQTNYSSHDQLNTRLKNAVAKTKLASTSSIGKSSGGKDITAVTLGTGVPSKNKAILIVAGADGKHPAGTEIATQLVEKLVALPSDSLNNLLKRGTIYIIPSLSPDALEQVTAKLKYERSGNATSRDDDRDGKFNEDPFEDLNGDGLITKIRVQDATGQYIISKEDSRLMVKADPLKGEIGKYLLLTEGTDNDKDGKFNEDPEGGVNIDKNFTFDYPMFEEEAGEYQASEPETRAFLDFLYANVNIHTVFHFGLTNNLSEPTKYDRTKASKRIISGLLESDATTTEFVSKMYNKVGLTDAPALPQKRGNLTQTAYYHAGRYSYVTPGWWLTKDTKDSTKKSPAKKGSSEAEYLKWADTEGLKSFVNWSEIKHPDFPNQKVEVGGFVPYALLNPPVQYLDSTVAKHQSFFAEYLKAMPQIELVNHKVESLGSGVNRITVTVVNTGLLATYPEIGDRIRYIYKVKTALQLTNEQKVISGNKNNYRKTMKPGESVEYSWVINGKGKVIIEAGSPTAGITNLELTLK